MTPHTLSQEPLKAYFNLAWADFPQSQEQEHWDHEAGRASEFQNCYTQSVGSLGPDRSHEKRAQAERLTRAGKFVVLCEVEVCCPVTDAFIRAETSIYKVCDTLTEAEEIANQEEGAPIWVYQLVISPGRTLNLKNLTL